MDSTKTNSNSDGEAAKNVAADQENPSSNSQINGILQVVQENGESNASAVVVDDNAIANESQTGNRTSRRTPFTNLSQEDADLALARTLQEQERAYMMLRMNGDGYGSWEVESYGHEDEDEDEDEFDDPSEEEFDGSALDEEQEGAEEEDAFDVHARAETGEDENLSVDLDPSAFSSDEAYARALQDAEEREMAARLLALAGLNEMYVGEDHDEEDQGGNSQDAWEEVDPDELSYEELLALGEVVGTESRGLSADTIASLPSVNYKSQNTQDGTSDTCVVCRLDYEDGDTLTVLSCKHSYHSDCISNWLRINKVCPVCSAEVSTSGNS